MMEDEELTAEDIAAIEEGRASLARGEGVPFAVVEAEIDARVTMDRIKRQVVKALYDDAVANPHTSFESAAEGAIAAALAALGAEGFVIVPKVPTGAMVEAAQKRTWDKNVMHMYSGIYTAMTEAAAKEREWTTGKSQQAG